MGKDGFDERVTSRIGGGFTVSVQVPSYELKLRLIGTFCNRTLADIGKKFGGRSHATIKHSIHTVEELAKDDKVFFDQLQRMKEGITSEA